MTNMKIQNNENETVHASNWDIISIGISQIPVNTYIYVKYFVLYWSKNTRTVYSIFFTSLFSEINICIHLFRYRSNWNRRISRSAITHIHVCNLWIFVENFLRVKVDRYVRFEIQKMNRHDVARRSNFLFLLFIFFITIQNLLVCIPRI